MTWGDKSNSPRTQAQIEAYLLGALSSTFATVEELFFVSQPFSVTAGLGASQEVLIGAIPIFARIDSILFAPSAAAPSNTGTNGWKFRPRRKQLRFTGASSSKTIDSRDLANTVYSRAWLAFEGISLDVLDISSSPYTLNNGTFFHPRDVMTISVEAVGTPVENCAGVFTVRAVPV